MKGCKSDSVMRPFIYRAQQLIQHPLPRYVRMLLVCVLFAVTLYPLGRMETSIGYLLPATLQFFWNEGWRYLLGLGIFFYLAYGLEYWRYIERPVNWVWRIISAWPTRVVLGCAMVFTSVAVWMCYWLYGFHPRIPDSVAQYVNAKMIASGTFLSPPPPLEDSFFMLCMLTNPIWISHYMPFHTLVQTIGHVVHTPWLINPLLGATSVVLIYLLALETHGRSVALGALFLATISPYLLFMSAEFMNHASSLMLSAGFYLFFVRTVKYRRQGDGMLAGMFLGLLLLTRVYTAILLGLPAAAYVLYWLAYDKSHRNALWNAFYPCAQVCVLFLLLMLIFNWLTTGDPLLFSSQLTHGAPRAIGFGEIPLIQQGFIGATHHTPWRGLLYTSNNFLGLNFFLWRWPLPSLLPVALLFLLRTRNGWNGRFLVFAMFLMVGHILHYSQDWCFGPRYVYESAPLLIILAAAGLARLPFLLRAVAGVRLRATAFRAGITLSVLFALIMGLPSWSAQRNIDGCTVPFRSAYQRAIEQGFTNMLLIVTDGDYVTAAVENPPRDEQPIIVIRNLGDALNERAMRYFPQRDVYTLEENGNFKLIRKGDPAAINPREN